MKCFVCCFSVFDAFPAVCRWLHCASPESEGLFDPLLHWQTLHGIPAYGGCLFVTVSQEELKCRFWLVMEIVIGSGLRCDWVSLSHQSPIDVRLESQSCVSSVYWFVCYTHDSLPLVFYWLSTAKIDCWQRVHVWLWMMLFTLNCEQTYLNLNSPANVRMNSNKLSCFFYLTP